MYGLDRENIEFAADRVADDARLDLVIGRRSVRRYRPEAVTSTMIDALLKIAVSAPSAHNRQPWRFRIVTGETEKAALADGMGQRLFRDRLADGNDAQIIKADVDRSRQRITGAPALIVVCMSLQDMDRYPDPKRSEAERLMAVQSVAMAGQNLLLAIHVAGLGGCWLCGPLFCPDVVTSVLGLPNDWQPQGLVTLGWPDGKGKPFTRRSLDNVCRYSTDHPALESTLAPVPSGSECGVS